MVDEGGESKLDRIVANAERLSVITRRLRTELDWPEGVTVSASSGLESFAAYVAGPRYSASFSGPTSMPDEDAERVLRALVLSVVIAEGTAAVGVKAS